jgi:hypothetical protein
MTRIKKLKKHTRDRAIKKASKSPCHFKIAALGFNSKGELVAVKTNSYGRKSTPQNGLHAEEKLFKLAAQKNIIKIIIVRVGKRGTILPIDPCKKCQKIADKLGIKIESIRE